ncbi:MAG TPA: VOC family protein [Polyangiaceae bacterium]|nr:VOC family protein [Polyangiaceae bacterium]
MANRKLFVNLPVRDLARSIEFFSKLGFEFNRQFTGDNAACMVINGDTCVMLLADSFFRTLTERQICDTSTHLQALLTVSCERRAEVDELVKRAIDGGGKHAGQPQDHGFMYDWSFYDLDGHGWGVAWMDPSALQQ